MSTTTCHRFVQQGVILVSPVPRVSPSSAGAAVWTWPYATNPFGENRPVSNTGYVLNLRLPRQYADGEAGLKYNLNRSFDAATGRYLESDPVGLAAGPSTYGYVEGNPLALIDPLGLWSFSFEAYLGFGGGIQFGRDPTSGEWFYGGHLGVGASIGGSLDPAGKRPGADGKDCTHGSTLGIFNQAGITIGPASWNPIQNSVGLNLDSSGKRYEEGGPADSLTLNRTSPKAFGIGWSTGIEVVGH
ncbi:RHS repeat-associated protein [Luteibacter sp. W1I16]|uniref:RHS repeat-associated core domain-containing protein n=1 Tax=Luteibacter sp. W1I16 TaxID=3373922 RepID=UPI003D1AA57A